MQHEKIIYFCTIVLAQVNSSSLVKKNDKLFCHVDVRLGSEKLQLNNWENKCRVMFLIRLAGGPLLLISAIAVPFWVLDLNKRQNRDTSLKCQDYICKTKNVNKRN